MQNRERFSSRLGFLLISAGCAIGIGNVWRFPYITGEYGGAAFVLVYLLFLCIMGLPIMAMEFAVGRASQRSAVRSFHLLEPKGTHWHLYGYFAMAGNYLLMMFYTTVGGWMLDYFVKMATGELQGLDAAGVEKAFYAMQAHPVEQIFWMALVVLLGFGVCSMGLQKGVERITKVMMSCLFLIMVMLAIHSCTLPGSQEGLAFYLVPDFSRMIESGFSEFIFAAMGQAFFTLSLGIGAMAIFGSYIGRDRSLMGEAVSVGVLDTMVAFMAGLIIFPACFAYGVDPGEGPGLVFVTLPNVFNHMPMGWLWGALFFLFMAFAALSTVIAVFENLISFAMDLWGWSRPKAVGVNLVLVFLLSLPCVLGFNLWSGFQVPGVGNIRLWKTSL
jgi:NSS family neurotransmitter:Na+ symporter